MVNPFNFEKDDARFVEASQDAHQRALRIARLSNARSWINVALLFQAVGLLILLRLESQGFPIKASMSFAGFAISIAVFNHIDLQIKFLKASNKD